MLLWERVGHLSCDCAFDIPEYVQNPIAWHALALGDLVQLAANQNTPSWRAA
jgi:hypothetical protein